MLLPPGLSLFDGSQVLGVREQEEQVRVSASSFQKEGCLVKKNLVCSRKYFKRLLSYITIATLGALGTGHNADAAIIVFEQTPPVVASVTALASGSPNSNFHGHNWFNMGGPLVASLGGGDANVANVEAYYNPNPTQHRNDDGTAGAGAVRVAVAGGIILVPTGSPATHVSPFGPGETIGPGLPTTGNNHLSRPTKVGGFSLSGGGGLFGEGYLGFRITRGGNFYYGWIEIETNAAGQLFAEATVTRWALETTPNTPIMTPSAVVPEPSSLALLAAGASALAMTRKKKVA